MRFDESESSEKLLHALLITQISKEDYKDFWTFSEISELSIDSLFLNFYINIQLLYGETYYNSLEKGGEGNA